MDLLDASHGRYLLAKIVVLALMLAIANANVPNMLVQISTALAGEGLHICNMVNKSSGELTMTLVDVESAVPQKAIDQLTAISGVLRVRYLPA